MNKYSITGQIEIFQVIEADSEQEAREIFIDHNRHTHSSGMEIFPEVIEVYKLDDDDDEDEDAD